MMIPIPFAKPDERFLVHRLKSTSLAGVVGGVTSVAIFTWHYYIDHFWSWDLFAVAAAIVGVKLAAMAWYRLRD
jgi:hypothetical protein